MRKIAQFLIPIVACLLVFTVQAKAEVKMIENVPYIN